MALCRNRSLRASRPVGPVRNGAGKRFVREKAAILRRSDSPQARVAPSPNADRAIIFAPSPRRRRSGIFCRRLRREIRSRFRRARIIRLAKSRSPGCAAAASALIRTAAWPGSTGGPGRLTGRAGKTWQIFSAHRSYSGMKAKRRNVPSSRGAAMRHPVFSNTSRCNAPGTDSPWSMPPPGSCGSGAGSDWKVGSRFSPRLRRL